MKYLLAFLLLAFSTPAVDAPLTTKYAFGNVVENGVHYVKVSVKNNTDKLAVGSKFSMVVIDAVGDRHTWPYNFESNQKLKPGKWVDMKWDMYDYVGKVEFILLKVLFADGMIWEKPTE